MAAAAITLGLLPIVAAASLRKEQADNNGRSGAVKLSGPSPRREELDGGRLPRQLQRGNDDALDVNGTVSTDTLLVFLALLKTEWVF